MQERRCKKDASATCRAGGIVGRHAMTPTADQGSSRITLFAIALIWMVAQVSLAVAHESWISRDGYGNPAGEWCCCDHGCQRRLQ
jgi:hypothetical protein